MSRLTSLNLSTKRVAAKTAGRGFEPLAHNAFRALGLAATASQREVADAASSVRLALKLGVRKTFEGDADWLASLSRTESDVRDALGRLSEPASRAFERLFWFHAGARVSPVSNVAELHATIDALLSTASPAALHDAALLGLAGLLRLDPALEDSDAWTLVFALWRELVELEAFWSLLVAEDLNGEYEQPVTFGEVRRLRLRAPRLISAPVAEHAKGSIVRGDLGACARAFSLLRGAGLPAALLEEYERDILGPAEDRLEEVCNAAFSSNALAAGFGEGAASRYNIVWSNFELSIKPQLRELVEMGGAQSPYVRRALEHAATKLVELAELYRGAGLQAQTLTLLQEARALAPEGSDALETVRVALLVQSSDTNVQERSFEEYAHALARELAEMRVPPKLPRAKAYAAPPVVKTDATDGCGTTALFWVVLVVLCFGLRLCGIGNTRRTGTYPSSNFKMNLNVNTNIVIPRFTPMPQMKIPPYLVEPPANNNARTRRRGTQSHGTTQNTMPLNLNLSPPVIVAPPLNRNASAPNRNAPTRD